MFETPSSDPSQAAPVPAPEAPEGADLLIRGQPHDEAFWDRHPDVERYKVAMKAGQADVQDWDVLIWLKPEASWAAASPEPKHDIPERPADATFVVHAAHDLDFFSRHPDLAAWRVALSLNEDGPGAVHTVEVWLKSDDAGNSHLMA
ncbi:hypothetical protein [Caulobacter sp.]|uniref:hypothetical protein n=1 Tax=Caulobacter sp. TaxID=78 RepID=UPI001B046E3B|nr:hypothetical protein [Caulobacter sp.]MBO9547165.1 hypothetical protein [Caulobacter sp.]